MDKKYELTSDSVKVDGHTLYRIRTIKDLSYVNAGRLGG